MAKRRRGKKTKKSKAVKLASLTNTTIPIVFGNNVTGGVVNVDRMLSMMNNRLYRQGYVYKQSFRIAEPGATESGQWWKFYTLPNNWFVLGAIRHAFRQYKAAMQTELTQSGGRMSRWHQFVVSPGNLDGSYGSNTARPTLWDGDSHFSESTGLTNVTASRLTDQGGHEMFFKVSGAEDHTGEGSYNIMLQYAKHLLANKETATAKSGPQSYEDLQSGGEDLDRLFELGDTAPYDDTFAVWHQGGDSNADTRLVQQDVLFVGDADPTGSRMATKQFHAPLGLVYVESNTASQTGNAHAQLILDVASGGYKGVSADPIFRSEMLGATAKSLR